MKCPHCNKSFKPKRTPKFEFKVSIRPLDETAQSSCDTCGRKFTAGERVLTLADQEAFPTAHCSDCFKKVASLTNGEPPKHTVCGHYWRTVTFAG